MRRLALGLIVAAAAGLVPAAVAGTTRTVRIGDNFYGPTKLTVTRGTTVRWLWPADVGDTHDVALRRGPSGVKKFESDVAAAAFSYRRRLTVKGTYRIFCTLHEEMTMTITVR